MSDIVRLKTQTQIDNEAAVWTWRLDRGELAPADRERFEAWLRTDDRHRRTFEELRGTWSLLDRLAERPWDEKLAGFTRQQAHRGLRHRTYWQAAAAVLVVTLGAALWLMRRPGMQVVSTAVGQQRHVTLADGSQVTLNTNTLIAVQLTAQRRDIYLRRGEAHFDVVHNASRPFFVHAGDTVIRDVGTQFEVRMRTDRDIDVLVNEGLVEVMGAPDTAGPSGRMSQAQAGNIGWARALSAGEQLHVAGPDLQLTSMSPKQVADDLAWRDGALVFEGEPLSEALADVERYTRTRIVLTGPTAASLRISGRFRIDDVPGFFQALQAALPVRVSYAQHGVVYIAAR